MTPKLRDEIAANNANAAARALMAGDAGHGRRPAEEFGGLLPLPPTAARVERCEPQALE